MKKRPGAHARYVKIDYKANDEAANAANGCQSRMSCGCQTCLSGAHSDGKTLEHCNKHDNDCHLSC